MLDATDEAIVLALSGNARMSLKELARHVGLSSPSVSERLRRLEERDVIRGYTLELNPKALGYQFQAIVRIRPLPGQLKAVQELIAGHARVLRVRQGHGRRLLRRAAPSAVARAARRHPRPHRGQGGDQHLHREGPDDPEAAAALRGAGEAPQPIGGAFRWVMSCFCIDAHHRHAMRPSRIDRP